MRLTFLVLAMMACASELRAQTHIAQLQGIIQSGMQPSSVPQPGAGVAVGPTNHIPQLQGIIQSGMQPTSVHPAAARAYVSTSNSYTGLTVSKRHTMHPHLVQHH